MGSYVSSEGGVLSLSPGFLRDIIEPVQLSYARLVLIDAILETSCLSQLRCDRGILCLDTVMAFALPRILSLLFF